METYLMIEFYLWHGMLMVGVIGASFVAGYYTAITKRRRDEST